MSIDLRAKLGLVRQRPTVQNEVAYYFTPVPSIAPLAFFHILYKPLCSKTVSQAAQRLRMPSALVAFFSRQNGASLFSSTIEVFGIHAPGQSLARSSPLSNLAMNIELENREAMTLQRSFGVAIAAYSFDGSRVFVGERGAVVMPSRGLRWRSLENWFTSEIARLSALFSSDGRRLGPESETLPDSGGPLAH
jgi:hypothetical protein